MAKLKLGAITDDQPVKLTIELPGSRASRSAFSTSVPRRSRFHRLCWMVQLGGLEPPTSCSTDRRSNQLSYNCILREARESGARMGRKLGATPLFGEAATHPIHPRTTTRQRTQVSQHSYELGKCASFDPSETRRSDFRRNNATVVPRCRSIAGDKAGRRSRPAFRR